MAFDCNCNRDDDINSSIEESMDKYVATCMRCGFPLKRGQIGCVIEGTMNDYYRKSEYPITVTYCYECRFALYQYGNESIETSKKRLEELLEFDKEDLLKREKAKSG